MCPYMRRKEVACSLSQVRKRELNYLTCYLELSIVEHGSNIFLEVKVHLGGSQESTGHLHQVGLELMISSLE